MISKEHYFDYAATSPVDEEIVKNALDLSLEHWGNPSSIHEAGTDARKVFEDARKRAADALGVKPESIFFTSGGTESDHLALTSVLSKPQKGSIVISAIEHPALREMAKMVSLCGWKTITVNPNKDGIVTAEAIAAAVEPDTAFVTVMAVNNETGAIQPVSEIANALVEKANGKRKPFFHVDCVQAAGKIPLDFLKNPAVDSAAFSAHKIGGPRGIGILYLAKDMNSFLKGGGQEKNVRSGTENLFGAEAISQCLSKYCIRENNPASIQRFENQEKWTEEFITRLMEIKGCVMIPHCRGKETDAAFSPWVVQAAFPGIPGQVMERALSTKGFYISTGSACSAGHHSRPILDTMQIPPKEKESAVRFSFGHDTTKEAMDQLIEAVKEVCQAFFH
ncbi:MAG: cysteine desulfurase family protein [Spirochaetales bacterium]|nr:cysteine desulfurase family protein [Spirochaetales bacterium]